MAPPEAIDACQGKSAGDPCQVTLRDRTMDGVCRAGPDGKGPLACAPARRGQTRAVVSAPGSAG